MPDRNATAEKAKNMPMTSTRFDIKTNDGILVDGELLGSVGSRSIFLRAFKGVHTRASNLLAREWLSS